MLLICEKKTVSFKVQTSFSEKCYVIKKITNKQNTKTKIQISETTNKQSHKNKITKGKNIQNKKRSNTKFILNNITNTKLQKRISYPDSYATNADFLRYKVFKQNQFIFCPHMWTSGMKGLIKNLSSVLCASVQVTPL